MPAKKDIISALKEAGITEERIEEEVQQLKDKFSNLMDNERLAYMKVAKNHNVDASFPELDRSRSTGDKRIDVKDIDSEECPEYFTISGYILDMWDHTTRKGNPAKKFRFCDKTGMITGATYTQEGVDTFEDADLEPFEQVEFSGASKYQFTVNEGTENERTITTLTVTFADINLPQDERVILDELKNIDESVLEDGEIGYIEGVVVDEQIREYNACTECGKKIDPETGECPRCSGVDWEERYFQTLFVSIGNSNFTVEMGPRISDGTSLDGEIIEVVGHWDSNAGRLNVSAVNIMVEERASPEQREDRNELKIQSGDIGEQERKILRAIYRLDGAVSIQDIAEEMGVTVDTIRNSVNMLVNSGTLLSPTIGKVDTDESILDELGIDYGTESAQADRETDREDEEEPEVEEVEEGTEEQEIPAETVQDTITDDFPCPHCDRILKSKGGRTRHIQSAHPEEIRSEEEETEEESSDTSEEEDTSEPDSEQSESVESVAEDTVEWLGHYNDLPEKVVRNKISKIIDDVDDVLELMEVYPNVHVEGNKWRYDESED